MTMTTPSIPDTITQLQAAYANKAVSVADVVAQVTERAHERNSSVQAYRELFSIPEADIQAAQERIVAGGAGPLCGVPIATKDNILIAGKQAGAASRILEPYVAPYDATVITRLKEAGALLVGRTNMDEFAMGSSTENSAYGPTKNPLDESRVPGGSSGGSAAAVAMGGAIAALGSDTGGSIRQPASFCGLVGLYPTYGTVSRYGLIALASSLDQIGPITRTVSDARALHGVLAGYDEKDNTSVPEQARRTEKTQVKKIGVPYDFIRSAGASDEVQKNFTQSVERLSSLGYEIVDISLPLAAYALAAYYIIMPAEAASNLARFDGIRYGKRAPGEDLEAVYKQSRGDGFGAEVKRRLLLGTYVLSHGYHDAYYKQAVSVRQKMKRDFAELFAEVDVIATPTTPTEAFALGERVADPVTMYAADLFTVPANIAGIPALSVPSGVSQAGLPLGLQLYGPAYGEALLFSVGEAFHDESIL